MFLQNKTKFYNPNAMRLTELIFEWEAPSRGADETKQRVSAKETRT